MLFRIIHKCWWLLLEISVSSGGTISIDAMGSTPLPLPRPQPVTRMPPNAKRWRPSSRRQTLLSNYRCLAAVNVRPCLSANDFPARRRPRPPSTRCSDEAMCVCVSCTFRPVAHSAQLSLRVAPPFLHQPRAIFSPARKTLKNITPRRRWVYSASVTMMEDAAS